MNDREQRIRGWHCPECGTTDMTQMTSGNGSSIACLECSADVVEDCGIECQHLWDFSHHPDLDLIDAETRDLMALFAEDGPPELAYGEPL